MTGSCDARFGAVRGALEENLARRDELGAAVTVILEGRPVVDLWCGWSDRACTRPWQRDTLVNVFSVGKALAALCVLMLASRGALELDEPLSRRWPEFGAAGKEGITIEQVLSHRAGVPAIARELPGSAVYDRELMSAALAAQEPWWTPGSVHGYHVHTFGLMASELVQRAAGERLEAFQRREVSGPLGLELGYGLEPGRRRRRAEYVFDATVERNARAARDAAAGGEPLSGGAGELRLRELAYMNPPGVSGIGTVNTTAWQDAELPSANLHADARSVARLYAALIDTRRPLLEADMLQRATREAADGVDLVLGRPSRFGLGFQLTQPERPLGPNDESFGHFGAGGSLGFADPRAQLAFAYVNNRGGVGWQDPRNRALIDAVYGSLTGGL